MSIFVLLAIVVLCVSGCAQNAAVGSDGAAPSVQICTSQEFDSSNIACKTEAATLSESGLAAARLVYSNGSNTFAGTDTTFVVNAVNAAGTANEIGSTDSKDSSAKQYSVEAVNLVWVMQHAGASSLHHLVYRVEVDNGGTKLGTADFTYIPSGPFVHICTRQHFDNKLFVCSHDDHSLSDSEFESAVVVYGEGDGTPFAGTNTHYIIALVNSDGTSSVQGTYDSNDTSLATTAEEQPLASLFLHASVIPSAGKTYSLEVDNKDQLLGVTTFVYH